MYLHYVGWSKVENLEEYTGIRVLWLEGNGLQQIQGLENQKDLRTLYLQENVLDKIENLENQVDLDTLNLGQNFIAKIENLSHMTHLQTLLLPQNKLALVENLEELTQLQSLSCLDIQKNDIDDPAILDLLEKCPNLAVVYLQGNPCVKKIRFYRKTVIARLKGLKYLDDRPVFPEERLRAKAWCNALESGDVEAAREAEKKEIERQRMEKKQVEDQNFKAFEKMMQDGLKIKEERENAAANSNPINPFSGEKVLKVSEAEALKTMRLEKLDRIVGRAEEPPAPPPLEPLDEPNQPPILCAAVPPAVPALGTDLDALD